MKRTAVEALLEELRNGPRSSDMQDRRLNPTVGPYLYAPWTKENALPFIDFLMRLQRAQAENARFFHRPPVYFPANSPLGRLQRAFGSRPDPLNRPDYAP